MPYIPTTWTDGSGEPISALNLNKIETGITAGVTHADAVHAPTNADNTAANETSHLNVVVDAGYVHTDNNLTTILINEIAANTAKASNIAHPLVETAVPLGAVFTDTNTETTTSISIAANVLTYVDELGVSTAIDLSLYLDDTNLAQLTSGVLNGTTGIATFTRSDLSTFTVDLSALLGGATYDDTAVLKDTDTVSPVTGLNKLMTQSDVAALGGGDMLASVYDTLGNGIVDNTELVNGLTVQTAVPALALFTDTDTVYNDTVIAAAVALNTAKVTNVDHPLVETAVPLGAVFTDTDTVYDGTDVVKAPLGVLPILSGINLTNLPAGTDGKSVDHVTRTIGTGVAGATDTWTAYYDVGELDIAFTFTQYNGTDGIQGTQGIQGVAGTDGLDGAAGVDGTSITIITQVAYDALVTPDPLVIYAIQG